MSIAFGIMAFAATWVILKLPGAFIAVLSGLALLPVLQRSFVTAFSGKFQMGALVTLLVTVSDITVWNIGAPFWGLVTGLAVSFALERNDYREYVQNAPVVSLGIPSRQSAADMVAMGGLEPPTPAL